MQYVILDLEWNNTYAKKLKRFFNEIIEIGAVKLDETLKVKDEFSCFIKAKVGKKLRTNTKAITSITNDDIKTGLPFAQAVCSFTDWIGSDKTVVLTWGDGDIRVLIDNCLYFDMGDTVPFLHYYMDLQKYFQRMIKQSSGNQIGLSMAAELAGISIENMSMHRALDDSIVSAECFRYVFENRIIREYIHTCNHEFYERLLYKNKVISNIKNPLVDRSYLSYKCELCGKQVKQVKKWKYSNQYFRAEYYCPDCDHRVQVLVRYKRYFDRTEVRKIIKPVTEEEHEKGCCDDADHDK